MKLKDAWEFVVWMVGQSILGGRGGTCKGGETPELGMFEDMVL